MTRVRDEKWVEKLAKDFPPERYKLTVPEVFDILDYKSDVICAMSTCYNYTNIQLK